MASPAMSFILDYLKRNKEAPYAEVQTAAKGEGHAVFPVMYGRAKGILGLIPVRRRGTGAGPVLPRVPRGRGGRSVLRVGSLQELKQFLASFREVQAERDRLREAIEQIATAARKALD
jgi:hypothetical protein